MQKSLQPFYTENFYRTFIDLIESWSKTFVAFHRSRYDYDPDPEEEQQQQGGEQGEEDAPWSRVPEPEPEPEPESPLRLQRAQQQQQQQQLPSALAHYECEFAPHGCRFTGAAHHPRGSNQSRIKSVARFSIFCLQYFLRNLKSNVSQECFSGDFPNLI